MNVNAGIDAILEEGERIAAATVDACGVCTVTQCSPAPIAVVCNTEVSRCEGVYDN